MSFSAASVKVSGIDEMKSEMKGSLTGKYAENKELTLFCLSVDIGYVIPNSDPIIYTLGDFKNFFWRRPRQGVEH